MTDATTKATEEVYHQPVADAAKDLTARARAGKPDAPDLAGAIERNAQSVVDGALDPKAPGHAAALQTAIKTSGEYDKAVAGDVRAIGEASIAQFQKDHPGAALTAAGVFDKKTREEIAALAGKQGTDGLGKVAQGLAAEQVNGRTPEEEARIAGGLGAIVAGERGRLTELATHTPRTPVQASHDDPVVPPATPNAKPPTAAGQLPQH